MDSNVFVFTPPVRPDDAPPWVPRSVRRRLNRIAGWHATAAADLALLGDAAPHHQRVLRQIAHEMRRELLAPWGVED